MDHYYNFPSDKGFIPHGFAFVMLKEEMQKHMKRCITWLDTWYALYMLLSGYVRNFAFYRPNA